MKRIILTMARVSLGCSLIAVVLSPIAEARGPQRSREGTEVLVSADAIRVPEMETLRPAPGRPIYYVYHQLNKSLGDSMGGVKTPAPDAIERQVTEELAKQGYVRAKVGGPKPTLVILSTYGDANFTVASDEDVAMYAGQSLRSQGGFTLDGYEQWDDAARIAYNSSRRAVDKDKIVAISGAAKVNTLDIQGMKILSAANDDRYYLTIAALDAESFRKKEKKMLWRTSMSVEWRNEFASSLPAMLSSGGPLFGVTTREPVFFDDRDRREATVNIGDVVVVPGEAEPLRRK